MMPQMHHADRFVALMAFGLVFALLFGSLSDSFSDWPSEAEHLVENVNAHDRLSLLGL